MTYDETLDELMNEDLDNPWLSQTIEPEAGIAGDTNSEDDEDQKLSVKKNFKSFIRPHS
jgi:hypothetical protein